MRKGGLLVLGLCALAGCSSKDDAAETLPPHDASLVEPPLDAGSDAKHKSDADADPGPTYDGPTLLSGTGLYSDPAAHTFAPDVRFYEVRQPLWMDGAVTKHYLYLPPATTIDTSYMEVWKFPIGTKAWREIYVDGKLLETRFLWKRASGDAGWSMVSYVWDENGVDATATPAGLKDIAGTTHDIPTSDDCQQCHNGQGDVLIGVAAIQLSKETGGGYLSTLISEGLLSDPPAAEFPVPGDGVVEKTLLYLHANCGHCHNDQNYLSQIRKLRLKLLTSATTPEETPAYKTTINQPMNHALGSDICVVPGDPAGSQLYQRMGVRDLLGMPTLDTEQVDQTALADVSQWILGLPKP